MSIDTDLATVLKTVCARTFTDFASVNTQRPYVTFQLIGGASWRFVEGAAADKRNTFVQINVWADKRLEANALARQIEEAMCAATLFTATPDSELVGDFDADVPVYGTRQDFNVTAAR
ncbi:MAG: DUF3168 domain-containing protein [Comamonadaceae bacterium]|nr:MAG: DUF3168 domain-containing protein [Comamonadaceae bacterium]